MKTSIKLIIRISSIKNCYRLWGMRHLLQIVTDCEVRDTYYNSESLFTAGR